MAVTSYDVQASNGFWKYVLAQEFSKEQIEKTSLSATYEDECTRINLSIENRFSGSSTADSVKALSITVQLKPLADFAFPDF